MPSEIAFSSSPFEATAADDQGDDYFSGHLGAGEDWQPDDIDEFAPRRRRIDTCNRTATTRTEGRSWRLRLSHDGAQVARLEPAAEDPDTADASALGTASDLVLFFYGRRTLDPLQFDGDRRIFDQLAAWDPSV